MSSRLRVAVLAGGRSSEHEISLASARSVAAALDPARYETTTIEIARDGRWELRPGGEALGEAAETVEVTRPILRRAAEPFPVPLGTLDAIHLATAMSWRDMRNREPVFATHDSALADAARATGFRVIG